MVSATATVNRILLCLAAALTVSVSTGALAGERGPIVFAKGASRAVVKGAVVRGDRELWRLSARKGQRLLLMIASPEKNAVFQVYAPGALATKGEDGWEVKGKALPGAGESDDAARLASVLPVTGAYMIVVGGTRGNADYALTAAIKSP